MKWLYLTAASRRKLAERRVGQATKGDTTSMELVDMGLSTLPEALGDLTNLTELDLKRNQLSTLPDWIGNLTNLTRLDLGRNQLSTLPDWIGNLTNLTELHLFGNRLSALPEAHGDLTNLTRLDLGLNQLSTLPDWIGNLTNLTELLLGRNRLSVLPDWIGDLANLTALHLDGNQLLALPEALGDLSNLTRLELEHNPLLSPPPEIWSAGASAVLAFLRDSRRESSRQWAAKLLVVGEGAVGKTSLLKALANITHDPNEPTTHGMRIGGLPLDHPREDGVTMTLATWDFGGQEIYHATHQFFLTDQSLFLIVWNPRTGQVQSRVRYWLDIVAARAPEAPVILVATHGDLRRPSDLPLSDLQREYPAIVGSYTVDSATGAGIADLRTEVTIQAANLPNMGRPWPTSWSKVADRLACGSKTHVTDSEMRRMMAESGVNDQGTQTVLAKLLHQQGVILHHDVHEHLADIVILQPEWLNTHISRILDSRAVAERAGVMTGADRDREWADVEPALRDHFLDMMDSFDLSYRVADPGSSHAVSIVVELLPHQAPDYTSRWDKALAEANSAELRVRYELAVMPPGIPTWFIAREHRFTTATHWRAGVLLRDRDALHLGLLRADRERKTIDLAVRGPMPLGFFAVLNDGLDLLLDRYPGLAVKRLVPCPCRGPGTCREYFDYGKLLSRLGRGRTDAECDATGTQIPILTLLAGITPTGRDTDPAEVADLRLIVAQESAKSQREILKALREIQKTHCPSVFTVTPSDKWRPGKTTHILRLYCEEPDAWHQLPGDEGCYEITELGPWLREYGPVAQRVLTFLSRAVPIAGMAAGLAAHALDGELKHDMEMMRELLPKHLPSHLALLGDPDPDGTFLRSNRVAPQTYADTDADFRVLASMLQTLDPRSHWGGLNRTVTPEGMTLYLCRDHARRYQT